MARDIQYNMWEEENAPQWLLVRLCSESTEKLCHIGMVLWGIWFFRNKKVWENKVVTPKFAMDWSFKQLVDWREANEKVVQGNNATKLKTR